jgi:hypothetical protein
VAGTKTIYRPVLIETYENKGDKFSREPIRARPVEDQGYPEDMNVACSKLKREEKQSGRKFILRCRLSQRLDGEKYLACPHDWEWYPVTEAEAERFINGETVCVNGEQFRRQPALT